MQKGYHETAKEIYRPSIPTFYIFKGVSGGGCSTALEKMVEEGLLQLSPPEFTTRPLRPTETRGHRHYPVSLEQLNKIRHQVVIQEYGYGNEYGFFKPAIQKIKRTLASQNVVVDSSALPDDWRRALGQDYRISTVFFAPGNPLLAVERIVSRAQKGSDANLANYLLIRAAENAEIIKKVAHFDYWVDTQDLPSVFPKVRSIIRGTSYGETVPSPSLSIPANPASISSLIDQYTSTDAVGHAKKLLNLQ